MRALLFVVLAGCAMPIVVRPGGGRSMAMGYGGTVAPAQVTVTSPAGEDRVGGNGGSYGEVHPFAYIAQASLSADLLQGRSCMLGIDLSMVGHNGVTGRCSVRPWLTLEAHLAWQVLSGPVTHAGVIVQHDAGNAIMVAGLRVSVGRHLHVLDLPDRYAASIGFEPGMGGAHARFRRVETRVEVPITVILGPDSSGFGVAISLVPYWVVDVGATTGRCDGCLPDVSVADFQEVIGLGIVVGAGGWFQRPP